jgi:hypothetical protein
MLLAGSKQYKRESGLQQCCADYGCQAVDGGPQNISASGQRHQDQRRQRRACQNYRRSGEPTLNQMVSHAMSRRPIATIHPAAWVTLWPGYGLTQRNVQATAAGAGGDQQGR